MKRWPALEIQFSSPELSDLVLAALTDVEVLAIGEDDQASIASVWRVFFRSSEARDAAGSVLLATFPQAELRIRSLDVPDEDWAARSQAGVTAVTVGNITVAPPWDPCVVGRAPGSRSPSVIVIQPSTGFGTGHHATTRLCLEALQHIDLSGRTVLDVGTGSGVLALAAERLGAAQVLAIDDDPDAIEAARENLALNGAKKVTVGTVDLRHATLRPFHLVVANLTGGLIVAAAATLQALSARGLVLSGFMNSEESGVLAAFANWTVARRSQEDEWVCVTLGRQDAALA